MSLHWVNGKDVIKIGQAITQAEQNKSDFMKDKPLLLINLKGRHHFYIET